jgi:hypothetical protein
MDRYPQLDQMNRTGEILKYLDVMRYKRDIDAYNRKRNAELDAERNKQNALQRSVTQDSLQTKQNTRNALAQAYQPPMADRADQDAGMMGAPRPIPPPEQVGMAVAAAGGSPSVSLPLINKGMGLDEAPEYQKTGAFLAEGPDGEPMIVVGIVNKATGDLHTETSVIPEARLISKIGETPEDRQQREIATAGGKETAKQREKTSAEIIAAGIEAAEGTAVLRRGLDILKTLETGGVQAASLAAKKFFGVESADEGELSYLLGKAVLLKLRATFGAAFTVEEEDELKRIEAGFGKSTPANRRLLVQAIRLATNKAYRARARAKARGDLETVREINQLLTFELEVPEGFDEQAETQGSKVLQFDENGELLQ